MTAASRWGGIGSIKWTLRGRPLCIASLFRAGSDTEGEIVMSIAVRPHLSRAWIALAMMAVVMIPWALFSPTLDIGLPYDDAIVVERAQTVASTGDFLSILFSPRGLTRLTHIADLALWSDHWGYHLTNLIIYHCCCCAVLLLVFAISRDVAVAVCATLIFVSHPIHVECVASIAFRKDMLATFFGTTGILFLLKRTEWLTPWPLLASAASFGASLLAKETTAVGIIIMAVVIVGVQPTLKRPRSRPHRLLYLVPLIGLVAGTLAYFRNRLTQAFSPEWISVLSNQCTEDWREIALHALGGCGRVAQNLLLPTSLSVDYSVSMSTNSVVAGIVALGASASLSLAFALRRLWTPAVAVAWVWVTYAPTSNVIPLTEFFAADRYLFAPSLGFSMFAAWILHRLASLGAACRGSLLLFATLIVTLFFLATSESRVADWATEERLWASAIREGNSTPRALNNLAVELDESGKLIEAEGLYRRAMQRLPSFRRARYNLAGLLARQARYHEAEGVLRGIVADFAEQTTDATYLIAVCQEARREYASAVRSYGRVIELEPDHLAARSGLDRINRLLVDGRKNNSQ